MSHLKNEITPYTPCTVSTDENNETYLLRNNQKLAHSSKIKVKSVNYTLYILYDLYDDTAGSCWDCCKASLHTGRCSSQILHCLLDCNYGTYPSLWRYSQHNHNPNPHRHHITALQHIICSCSNPFHNLLHYMADKSMEFTTF